MTLYTNKKHRIRSYVYFLFSLFLFFMFFFSSSGLTQNKGFRFKGKIRNSIDGKPIETAMIIILEANIKSYSDSAGDFDISVSNPGTYTVIISSPGMQQIKTKLEINSDTERNFIMASASIMGKGLTVTGDREKQKISRYNMTVQQIKEAPGTFGDSVSALSTLPNVSRAWGLFGPMIIRGADPASNGYYIDGIPMYDIMHFSLVHSVINNDLISDIDLYSSAFPASIGHAQGGIIHINTIDKVDEFGGNAELGLLSSSLLLKTPITETENMTGEKKQVNRGYFIVAGRIGYIPIAVSAISKVINGEKTRGLPYYGDYQLKGKYFIDKDNSLTFLSFGHNDYWSMKQTESENGEGGDPLEVGSKFKFQTACSGNGITYDYRPSERFENSILFFGTIINSTTEYSFPKSPQAVMAKGSTVHSKPYILGIKDNLKLEWMKKNAELNIGFEYINYYFRTNGNILYPKKNVDEEEFDPAKDQYESIKLKKKTMNFSVGGFIENKFSLGDLKLVPGVRVEYFSLGKQSYADPRGMICYSFPSETVLSAASGIYSYFIQESPYYYKEFPEIARISYLSEQKSIHNSVGIEQKYFGRWKTKLEGFYNYFYDLAESEHYETSNGEKRIAKNCGRLRTYGFEIVQSLDPDEGKPCFYGSLSYTLDQSKYRSGAKNDDSKYWNKWIDSYYEMVHIIKFTGAYTKNGHTFSARLNFNTSAPYTPITGASKDESYKGKNSERWVPITGERNSKRYSPDYRLDVRYSYRSGYEWGYTTWFFEVINVTNHKTAYQEWDYRRPYGKNNPSIKKPEGMAWLPNMGAEVKF